MANLHDNLKTNMAAIANKAYCLNCPDKIEVRGSFLPFIEI